MIQCSYYRMSPQNCKFSYTMLVLITYQNFCFLLLSQSEFKHINIHGWCDLWQLFGQSLVLVCSGVFPLPADRGHNVPRTAQGTWDNLKRSWDVALEPAGLSASSLNLLLLAFRKLLLECKMVFYTGARVRAE